MSPFVLNDTIRWLEQVFDAALDKWNEGLVPFFTSPYGIFVLFVALFVFLNSMRMRL
jgi:hypothetical protein